MEWFKNSNENFKNETYTLSRAEQLYLENEQQAFLVTKFMKDNVENIQNMPDNEWNQMLDILRIKIEQCNNYAETLNSLRVYDDNEKKKIKTII